MPQTRLATGSFTTRWSVQYNCIRHALKDQEIVKTREDWELAERGRDMVRRV